MPRKPSGRIDVCLRIKADLYQRLKEIAKARNCTIADLIEPKIIELIALHEAGLGVDRWGFEPQAFAMPRRRSTRLSYRPSASYETEVIKNVSLKFRRSALPYQKRHPKQFSNRPNYCKVCSQRSFQLRFCLYPEQLQADRA